jgi:hypothetical protein
MTGPFPTRLSGGPSASAVQSALRAWRSSWSDAVANGSRRNCKMQIAEFELQKKSKASFGVTGIAGPRIGGEQHLEIKMVARGRTGSSPAHSLRQPGDHRSEDRRPIALRPHLSMSLPFRGLKGVLIRARHRSLPPEAATKAGSPVCYASLGHGTRPGNFWQRDLPKLPGLRHRPGFPGTRGADAAPLAC